MTSSQQDIIATLHPRPHIDPADEIRRRVSFLVDYLASTPATGFVLGISGGQDSTLAGRLAQEAAERTRAAGREAVFVAVRLPYRTQQDEDDAQLALKFIEPDHTVTVNIGAATDAMATDVAASLPQQLLVPAAGEPRLRDFVRGNIKARMRMVAQFAIAGQLGLLVVGSDHAAEAATGFYTKFGDGAADVMPLAGLTKRQGAALLQHLGADDRLWQKVPTADLEDDRPGQPDEDALGVTYADLDTYLEGGQVSAAAQERIRHLYEVSAHKRHVPVTPTDTWWK